MTGLVTILNDDELTEEDTKVLPETARGNLGKRELSEMVFRWSVGKARGWFLRRGEGIGDDCFVLRESGGGARVAMAVIQAEKCGR